MKKSLKLLAMAIALIVVLGGIVSPVSAKHLKNGEIVTYDVDAGGFNLKMDISNMKAKYTVVFEHGLGADRTWWDAIQPEIAKYANTVSYDRAGAGESEVSPSPRSFSTMCEELHTALKNAKVKGPYIFVGHSWGGAMSRIYATKYPKEVKGIVFVDSSHEDMYSMMISAEGPEFVDEINSEVVGLENNTLQNLYDCFQELRDSRKLDSIRNTPIKVLAGNKQVSEKYDLGWLELQKDIASLSDDSIYTEVDGSHFIPEEQPQAVIDAVLETLQRVKKKNNDKPCKP